MSLRHLIRCLVRCLVACFALCAFAASGTAQVRVSIGLELGTSLPLSPSARNIVVNPIDASVSGPQLGNYWNRLGGVTTLDIRLDNLSLRYSFSSFGWSRIAVRCGSPAGSSAPELITGEVEDLAVAYDCDMPREVRSLNGEEMTRLSIHRAGVSLLSTSRLRDDWQFVGSAGPGISVTSFRHQVAGPVRIGGHLLAAAHVEFRAQQRITVAIGLQLATDFIPTSSSSTNSARRASAAGTGAFTAIFDTYHTLGLSVALRYHAR